MATLATAKTLTVKITEDITLNGVQQGNTTTDTISSISQIYKRIMTIPVNDGSIGSDDHVTIITTTGDSGSAVEAGKFIVGDIKYCRLTNLNTGAGEGLIVNIARDDDSDGTDDEGAWLLLEEGKSMIINTFDAAFDADNADADAPTLDAITDIRVVNEHTSNAVDLEVFVASS
tara:strand:+ start:7267 stop:7788 length:522 start_codon:yes stop_codon:yes gene_type:complete